jgi:hypothetical protein
MVGITVRLRTKGPAYFRDRRGLDAEVRFAQDCGPGHPIPARWGFPHIEEFIRQFRSLGRPFLRWSINGAPISSFGAPWLPVEAN